MRNKNGIYKFWKRPVMAMLTLFGLAMFTVALIFSTTQGIYDLIGHYNDVIGIVLYIFVVVFFALCSAFTLFMGIRYCWLRVIIDSEKVTIKYLFSKKILTECKIADIKEVQAKYINREAKFIVIKDDRQSNSNKIVQRDGYVIFVYTKKRLDLVKTFWTGHIDIDWTPNEW